MKSPKYALNRDKYLSPEAIEVLEVLRLRGPMTTPEIAKALGKDPRDLDKAMALLRKHERIVRREATRKGRVWGLRE